MESIVCIKSAHDGTALELFGRSGGYYRVRLAGPNFNGVASVYEYEPIYLKMFFSGLAANWKGWSGRKEWASLEGELSLSAVADSTGHINLSVRIRSGDFPFNWNLSATLLLEPGQLDQISASVRTFFAGRSAE